MDNLTTADYELIVLMAILVVVALIAAILTYRLMSEARVPSSDGSPEASRLVRLLHSEPALLAGVVSAAAGLTAAFGLELDAEQTGAIVAFISIILAIVVRQSVYSPATIASSGLAYDEADGQLKRRVR